MQDGQPGGNWTDDQNDLIVADYFEMLGLELSGQPYIKAHRNAALHEITGRSKKSIERKHMNISAVVIRLGLPRINGYAPLQNFQASLIAAVERYIVKQNVPTFEAKLVASSKFTEGQSLWVGPPPDAKPSKQESASGLDRLIRKFDPANRDALNRALGKAGEELVLEHEIRNLTNAGRPDLAKKVEWTSQERGDGAGFDIASFEESGMPRLIEVKTTNGSSLTPFFLSANELSFAKERPDAFKLLRIYNFSDKPMGFELTPPLDLTLSLTPTSYRAVLL
jgi:hypothetical protein